MRRLSPWLALIVVLVVLVSLGPLARWVTDAWWFASVGFGGVFRTVLLTELALAAIGGGVAVLLVGGSSRFAARWNRPRPGATRGPRFGTRDAVARISPVAAADVVTLLVALASAGAAASRWQEVQLLVEGGAFGWLDPVWQVDAQFYVFDLGPVVAVVRWLAILVVVAFVVSAGIYVALGTVRVQLVQQDGQLVASGIVVPPEVRRHVGSLVATLLVLMSILSYLRRYGAMVDPSGLFAGPGYAEIHSTLPLLTIEAVGTAICAFVASVVIGRGSPSGIAAVAIAIGVLKGGTAIAPLAAQRLSVKPNELSRETPQIAHHLRATRFAFGLDAIGQQTLSAPAELDPAGIERSRGTLENVRLWDRAPLLETLGQVQEIRGCYGFVGVDEDRYVLDGRLRQTMLAPRELVVDELPVQARTWVNETMLYTHGYGVVLGPVSEIGAQGLPELFVRDVPPEVDHPEALELSRPEIYFGEATDRPVVVGTANPEFDHPSGEENATTRYAGRDGVRLGWFGRLMFALRLGSTEILLSGDVSSDSRVLLYRDVTERASRIAPFLRYDADPYLVIDQGRLVWILDAYTTSERFPYAAPVEGFGNYLRNPVKVTVDAWDGTVVFYRTPIADPIADAWGRVFPDLFRPLAEMPASLAAHLRYPVDQFAAQASLYATIHADDPAAFYDREDEWEVPVVGGTRMTPYHAVLRLPGEETEEFVLMLPFGPKGKTNLAAWLVARSDGAAWGQLRAYTFPKDTIVRGPQMVAARISQDDAIGEKLSQWAQQGARVEFGTLRVVPIEDALIYVQPLYLVALHGSIPELKRVIVSHQDRIAMGTTLDDALERLFGPAPPIPAPGALAMPDVTTAELVRRAGLHWDAAQLAMQRGDWAEYGVQNRALGEVIETLRSGVR